MEIELENLHLSILLLTAIAIIWSDHLGFAYMRGSKPLLDSTVTTRLHYIVWAGLIGMIVTGFLMIYPPSLGLLSYTPFVVKMLMVAALVANGVLIGNLTHVASQTPFAQLPLSTKRKLFASGAISGICWAGAAFIGFFIL